MAVISGNQLWCSDRNRDNLRNIYAECIAIIGFFLVALVILVTIYEYWRGAKARQRSQNENIFTAFWNLTSRNRRRYGGYIIHLSMMLMAIGILGIELFQTETQGTVSTGESIDIAGYTVQYKEVLRGTCSQRRELHPRSRGYI